MAQGRGEKGTVWVKEDGSSAATIATTDLKGDGPTAEMEILRGDPGRLLYEAVGQRDAYRFGDHINAVSNEERGVLVTFESSVSEQCALLIVAEGVGSSTRELLFSGENQPRWMDLTTAHFPDPSPG